MDEHTKRELAKPLTGAEGSLREKVLDLVGWAEHAINEDGRDRQLILEALIAGLRKAAGS